MKRNQRAEDGLDSELSFESDGNDCEHNSETVLILWEPLSRKDVDWRKWQGITICISEMLLTSNVQL